MSEAENARWYVVHTYSGYENKVKADIEKTKENRNLQDQILEVVVPVEDATELHGMLYVIPEELQDLSDQIQESLYHSLMRS